MSDRIPPLIYDPDPELARLEFALDDARESCDPQRIANAQGARDKAVAHAAVGWAPQPGPEPEAG